jgi:hypothetical protein
MKGLTEGRIVHYVCPGTGRHRAAIVTNLVDWVTGVCDLFVFSMPDDGLGGFFMRSGAGFDPGASEGTWHWVEEAQGC